MRTFYGREKEIEALHRIHNLSKDNAQMTVITGRRRIGKTTLVAKACEGYTMLYFFIGRKSEALLCEEFAEEVRMRLGCDIGSFNSFPRLLSVIMDKARERHIILVLDEFQNFKFVNEAIFSDMQNLWDRHKAEAHIHLILCGSVQTMMAKIFDDRREPLYGRANNRIAVTPFTTSTLMEILRDHNASFTPDDLLTLFMTTGGVAKYVEEMMTHNATDKESMLREFFSVSSYFIPEGKDMLSDEFGREGVNYFTILSAIADGHNERGGIKSHTDIEPGGFLDRLEKDYCLITRQRPYGASEKGQNVHYAITDMFLNFWFRFVHKYRSAIEMGNMDYVIGKVMADYDTYSGRILEMYFRRRFRETGIYNLVTNYWERNGGNEIDLIAVSDTERELVIGEIKRNPNRISLPQLEAKAHSIIAAHRKFKVRFIALSLDDMTTQQPATLYVK